MLHIVTFRVLAVAACGCLLALDAAALSLGPARGAVLVGRPLELTIPATLDAAETDPCADADVFYGEQRITRTPTVRWEPRAGKEGVLRVSSELPVDEPMVTVYLRVGCGQASTRKYVMLAEVPPAEASVNPGRAAAPRSLPVVPSAPPSPAAAPAAPAPATAAPRIAAPVRPAAPASAAAPVARRPSAQARPRPETPNAPPRPVLKLEPLDLSIDHSPTLRLSTEIGTQPSLDAGKRQAAAALWQALQKAPEEALQDAQRLQALQGELQSVREATRQNAAAVAGMRAQVEKAQGERSTASLLALVLAALLAVVLAMIGWRRYRIHRVERVGRWFEAHGNAQAAAAVPREPAVDLTLDAAAAPVTAPAPAVAPAARAAVVPVTSPAPLLDFQPSRGASVRMVGVEELLDVHDKADFFLSIGEVDQAVAVLEGHVHDQVDTSALPWMDLLELYHSRGRRSDFDRLRREFRERFSGEVPDFDHFDQPTPTLESYERALSRIVALWPTRRVLDVIEESIFRKPGLLGAESFSLEAYRELVLLYHIATDIAPVDSAPRNPPRITNFSDTSLQPLHDLDAPERPRPDVDLLLVPPASPNLGVDIDVTAPEEDDEPETLPPLDFDLDPPQDEPPDPGRGRG
ncbi:MAG: hypothetical protein K0R58_2247 [Ramlibacter sp.]|jgi:hypothetical protein|nr:hypothetical protein [Ramlibacter sp.]